MPSKAAPLPRTLGALRESSFSEARIGGRSVKDELRNNLICGLQRGEALFPGIVGYEDTVVPQLVNAVLSRHNFILLGLRGQAKTRLMRMLTALLDETIPYVEGCEIHDNPYRPICRRCRDLLAERGDDTPIAWLRRDQRYVEKLATPDVTIADMIGDIDPIKAARRGQDISDELTVHYGLLPRSNRGIFAINELPDLAGKIQVGLFNIMQEGDVQIKGYPIRLPLDLALVFTANPEDYTARGKIVTPLKDRIGSEIRTHYPATLEQGIAITGQEAWLERPSPVEVRIPAYMRRTVEQLTFLRGQAYRQAFGRFPAPAHLGARKRGFERGAAGAEGARAGGRAAHRGSLLRAAGHYRKTGAGVRGRAEGRRRGGAGADPGGGGPCLQPVFRRRQRGEHHPVVRPGRVVEAR
jgi:magnesium chelatase subunit I